MDDLIGAGGHHRIDVPVVAQDDDLFPILCGDDVGGVAVGEVMAVCCFVLIDQAAQLYKRVAVVVLVTQYSIAGAVVVSIVVGLLAVLWLIVRHQSDVAG